MQQLARSMIMYTESFTKWLQPAVNRGAEASNQNIEKSIVVTRYMPLPDVWGTLSEFFKRNMVTRSPEQGETNMATAIHPVEVHASAAVNRNDHAQVA